MAVYIQKKGLRPLIQSARPLMQKSLGMAGFSQSDIILRWAEIVGDDLYKLTLPLKISWPKRPQNDAPQDPGTLYLRVESAIVLDITHQKSLILERVNAYFGWRAVQDIKITQGPVLRKLPYAPVKPTLQAAKKVAKLVETIEDEALKAALISLGSHIYAGKKR
jgi:hypothetical protein